MKFKKGDIYHLIAPRGNYTLCGLKVSRMNLGGTKLGDPEEQITNGETEVLCKHCERIERQEASE